VEVGLNKLKNFT